MIAPRILVVADDGSTSNTVQRALSPTRAVIHAATGASAALSLLAHHPIDIVFVDLDSRDDAGLDAVEFTRLVCERKLEVDIIAIAATPSASITMDVIATGAADCLGKAELADEVGSMINRIMERRHYRHERVPWPNKGREDSAIIGHDPRLMQVYKQVPRLAKSDAPVLIVGERGTGKTAIARAIHNNSSRAHEAFEVLECTSLTESLAEAQLFGHVKGAFTDAKGDHRGYFERAARGTLMIDEIAFLPFGVQGKLLRVLQDGEFMRIGSETPCETHARVLSVTNRPLEPLVDSGEFRPDLYDRLAVARLDVPPLRDRRGDIPDLARHFIAKAARELKLTEPPFIAPDALGYLVQRDWPGNVRELESVIRTAVLSTLPYAARVILVRDLHLNDGWKPALDNPREGARPGGRPTRKSRYVEPEDPAVEEQRIRAALAAARWNVTRAAEALGMSRRTLWERMRRYRIARDDQS